MSYKFKFFFQIIIVSSLFLLHSCNPEKKQVKENYQLAFFDENLYQFVEVDQSIQMAYLDIGNKNHPIVLLLHGEPNSSFVYRNIAPNIAKNGFRVIIPDLVGFGFSSKPKNADIITYANETKWLHAFLKQLNLNNINLFAHDWGAMISLRIVAEEPTKFNKVAISYGYLFEGTEEIPESFKGFRNYAKNASDFLPGNIMDWGSDINLSDSIKAIYNSPFKVKSDYNVVRKFPSLIPMQEKDPEAILNKKLNEKLKYFDKPFITIWGNHKDLMWTGKDKLLQQNITGAKNHKHYMLESNHFIQEDQPVELTNILIDFFN